VSQRDRNQDTGPQAKSKPCKSYGDGETVARTKDGGCYQEKELTEKLSVVKLPKLTILSFNGTPIDWVQFNKVILLGIYQSQSNSKLRMNIMQGYFFSSRNMTFNY